MFGNNLHISLSISPDSIDWLPSFSGVWGEATHFVHKDLDSENLNNYAESEGVPLNKEYSFNISWLFFYFNLSLSLERSSNA